MEKLPENFVPKLGSKGAKNRAKLLASQIPLQDFSCKHCKRLTLDQKMAMDDFSEKRLLGALGVGKYIIKTASNFECQNLTTW